MSFFILLSKYSDVVELQKKKKKTEFSLIFSAYVAASFTRKVFWKKTATESDKILIDDWYSFTHNVPSAK